MNLMESNATHWGIIVQFGILSLSILGANIIRRKVSFMKNVHLPTAILAGFILLLLKTLGIIYIDTSFMEIITYHTIALGFISLTLRSHPVEESSITLSQKKDGLNTAVVIVATYLLQGLIGILITITLYYMNFPEVEKALGILLPMGFGQGPGQANNIGMTYEITYGFVGAKSFSLALATAGFLWAYTGGVVYLNHLRKKGYYQFKDNKLTESINTEILAEEDEIPLTEAVDKFTIQISLVSMVYLFTYIIAFGMSWLFKNITILNSLEKTIVPLIWGFNFLIGTIVSMIINNILCKLREKKWMTRKYTNNYMLNRISGVCFDYMIAASIAIINIGDLSKLWMPFIIISTIGGILTFVYLKYVTKKLYPTYKEEAMLSLYGMLTGTVSSGVLLLREIDSNFKTPASNNLIIGSANAIILGLPMLIFVGLAPMSDKLLYLTLILIVVYMLVLNIYLFKNKNSK